MSFIFNPLTGRLNNIPDSLTECDLIEAFVPYGEGVASNSTGIKGQWSWNPETESLLYCVASNTWVNLYTLEKLAKDSFLKTADIVEKFIPSSKVTSSNADGIKGQWSYSSTYFYKCIATNTWVRYAVETSF